MTTEPYKPLYKWRRTKLDENDVPTDSDWSGYDGEIGIGRIQLQDHSAMKGRWMWNLHGPIRIKTRISPHSGYIDDGREAMRKVEERYHDLMAANGMKGSKQ